MSETNPNIVGDFYNPYQQAYNDTCAIKSQQLILNDFGIPVTEDQCVAYSIEHGWYSGDGTGTQATDVGKLLEDAGIPCTSQDGCNVYDLVNQLSQGHKVIVGVDSGELWEGSFLEWLEDFFSGEVPDHALIVAGIDMSDPENPTVILTDPGTGEVAKTYPMEQFMDAWADSNCMMVSTDIATPEATQDMITNGLTEGHLNDVAGVDYDTFTQFQDYSHQIDMATQGQQLYDVFQTYPTMPVGTDFSMALQQFDMPPFDFSYVPPMPTGYIDPFSFDYTGLNDMSWLTDIPTPPYFPDTTGMTGMPGFDPFATTDTASSGLTETDRHSLEVLNDCLETAQQQAQSCIEDGMPVSAQMWNHQAAETQQAIDDILNP